MGLGRRADLFPHAVVHITPAQPGHWNRSQTLSEQAPQHHEAAPTCAMTGQRPGFLSPPSVLSLWAPAVVRLGAAHSRHHPGTWKAFSRLVEHPLLGSPLPRVSPPQVDGQAPRHREV